MSAPAHPQMSPDGKFYCDGQRWVPMGPGSTNRQSKAVSTSAIVFIGLLIVGGLVWYFGFYDTAAGRCNRGDLGACVVAVGQQAAQQAAVASASADAQASADAAAAQQQANEKTR